MSKTPAITHSRIHIPGFCLLILLLACSCQSVPQADASAATMLGRQLYTATNLRLFQEQYIYWQNRMDGKLLPLGTAVRIVEVSQETAKLLDNKNNTYLLCWQDANSEPKQTFASQVHRYLRENDPKLDLETWSDVDKTTVQNGDVRRGMSQEQVLLAWGYPPGVANPKELDTWLYWLNPWKMCAVRFDNGVVAEIVR